MNLSDDKKNLLDKIFVLYDKEVNSKKYNSNELYKANFSFITQSEVSDAFNQIFENPLSSISIVELEKIAKKPQNIDLILAYLDINNIDVNYVIDDCCFEEDSTKAYFKEISKYPPYTKEEEIRAFTQYQKTNSDDDREDIICHNLKLVVYFAKKYRNGKTQLLDLIQEGNIGLMQAIDCFDLSHNVKFSTYAAFFIRSRIAASTISKERTIKISANIMKSIIKLRRTKADLMQELEREPSLNELAQKMQISLIELQQIQSYMEEPTSLDAPLEGSNEFTLKDVLSDPNDPFEKGEIDTIALQSKMKKIINNDERLAILCDTFGINVKQPLTPNELESKYNLPKIRINQINNNSLARIRHNFDFRINFKDYKK